MPRKQRRSKRRADPAAEAEAWSCVFTTGRDFFGRAERFSGLPYPLRVGPDDRIEAERAWKAAARDAWGRVGRRYLNHDMGAGYNCGTLGAWALREFGPPEKDDDERTDDDDNH